MFNNATLLAPPPMPTYPATLKPGASTAMKAARVHALVVYERELRKREKELKKREPAISFLDDLQDMVINPHWPQSHAETRRGSVLLTRARRWYRTGNVAGVLRLAKVYA